MIKLYCLLCILNGFIGIIGFIEVGLNNAGTLLNLILATLWVMAMIILDDSKRENICES